MTTARRYFALRNTLLLGASVVSAFSPSELFAASEQGVWYDPSDLSTLFQDSAGTIPVTAVEQPVGKILDKSGRGNHASQSTESSRPLLSARVNLLLATATLSTQNVTTLAATYTLAFSGAGTVTATGTNIGVYSAGSNSLVCTAGTLTLTVVGSVTLADLRVTNVGVGLPAYQAVVTSTNYDTSGFPLYLKFDGTDDSLATGTITPGAVDKAQVFAGVGKFDTTAYHCLAEYGADPNTNAGTVALWAPWAIANGYGLLARGATATCLYQPVSYSSPINNVVAGIFDLSGADLASTTKPRVNAVTDADNGTGTTSGGGNISSQTLYIGRRTNTAFPFNGRIYSLILRFSASNLSDAQIASAEAYVNAKTGAY